MRKLELDEIQKKEYEILCAFDKVCREQKLRYSLCGGTLLGAIRHGGFIPWDDDIDVLMPRPDYEKLIEIADKVLPSYYKLVNPYSDLNTFHAYGKICDLRTELIEFPKTKKISTNLYIDIFPVDGMPNNVKLQEKHRLKTRIRMLTLYAFKIAKYKTNEKLNFLSKCFWRVIKLVNKMVPKRLLIKRVDKLVKKYDFDNSKFAGVIVAGYGSREIMPSIVFKFDENISFCGTKFYATIKPDYYLTSIYSDYMQLPPESERINHGMEVYEKDGENDK